MFTSIDLPGIRATIKSWLPVEEIEAGALAQIGNAARHPEVADTVAIMPDCHVGYGVTIGSIFPTLNAIVPNAVGVDIGCGVAAVNTGMQLDRERMDRPLWQSWARQVGREVPTGFTWHTSPQPLGDLDRALRATELQPLIRKRAAVQLGTLGGGNHFLEAQVDERGYIWLMVHSGSRATGLKIANHYNQKAMEVTRKRDLGVEKDLSSLPLDDRIAQDYIHDMAWATDFALASRQRMISRMLAALQSQVERVASVSIDTDAEQFINIHHNFAELEEHHGQQVMVHRKGATSARHGQMGIIPGSMGSSSFIVRGRGNEDSLRSCSHGAGRRLGRRAAKKTITESEFALALEGTYSKPSMSYVDEAPGAYKNVQTVIDRQRDLIDVVHTLQPIITIKGDSKARED